MPSLCQNLSVFDVVMFNGLLGYNTMFFCFLEKILSPRLLLLELLDGLGYRQ